MAHADRSTVPDATQAAGINPNPTRKTKMPNNITLTQDQIDAVMSIIDSQMAQFGIDCDGMRESVFFSLDAMRTPEVEFDRETLQGIARLRE
jgi:hypothetical protein